MEDIDIELANNYHETWVNTVADTVKYLRHVENEQSGQGYLLLTDLMDKGAIKKPLYDKLKETLDNPALKVHITIDEE